MLLHLPDPSGGANSAYFSGLSARCFSACFSLKGHVLPCCSLLFSFAAGERFFGCLASRPARHFLFINCESHWCIQSHVKCLVGSNNSLPTQALWSTSVGRGDKAMAGNCLHLKFAGIVSLHLLNYRLNDNWSAPGALLADSSRKTLTWFPRP